MNLLSKIVQSQRFHIYSGMLLAVLWGLFAYAHLFKFQQTGDWTLVLAIISETLAAGLFLVRSTPKTVSLTPFDWLIGVAGTFMPTLFRPATWGVFPLASIVMVLGTMLSIASLLSLNRSFAIVAAKREIKTEWMYRIVRHPIYASYILTFGCYVLVHTTLANLLVYAMLGGTLCTRIIREEKHLALDPAYRAYMLEVRYRLIPFVY